jgi:hypothetical protein
MPAERERSVEHGLSPFDRLRGDLARRVKARQARPSFLEKRSKKLLLTGTKLQMT